MLSGVKIIPRSQVQEERPRSSSKERNKTGSSKQKHRRKSKRSHYISSSDDEELEKIKRGTRRRKKVYSSDEYTSLSSSGSESEIDSDDHGTRKHKSRRKDRRNWDDTWAEGSKKSRKGSKTGKKHYSSEDDDSAFDSARESKDRNQRNKRKNGGPIDDVETEGMEIKRKEIGLEWMVRPKENNDQKPMKLSEPILEECQPEEAKKNNPRELNPYLKDNGSGYPEEPGHLNTGASQLLSSSLIGDGGLSWKVKALKRAQEQAAREGRDFKEVVEERWGSVSQLAVAVSSRTAAPSRAHLHAIKNRKKNLMDDEHGAADTDRNKMDVEKNDHRDYLRDVSLRHPEMRAPKVHDSLSWGKRKGKKISSRDSGIISAAASSINKFANDGSFMSGFAHDDNGESSGSPLPCVNVAKKVDPQFVSSETIKQPDESSVKQTLSANQLAAKALQLRMKGKHEEADKLLKEAESLKLKQVPGDKSVGWKTEEAANGFTKQEIYKQRRKEENSDAHLAERIMKNKQFSVTSQADDEYDFDDGPSRKNRKKAGIDHKSKDNSNFSRRILTQQERCLFCFDNPNRPRHLVVSIANFSYLMLPQWKPVVTGHCCILPLQHESATRTVDDNVWDEIRNFKKCLIMMFGKQDKDVVFLETVMGLAQQRRHCLIECVPLPRDIAKEAPLYFKKAIDEAEDEWSQHNAKRLIDTSVKGLRASIPKGFPYFHVEFGLNRGFVHVIDDEDQFKSSFGLNVIRGMLRLPEEDMHRRRRQESNETQKQAVLSFVQDWEEFDWTKQLG